MELVQPLTFPGIDAKTTAALLEILPSEYYYSISTAQLSPPSKITATFKVNLFNESEAREWLKRLEEKTYTTYNVRNKTRTAGRLIDYKCVFNCQHHTRSLRKNSDQDRNIKNTFCPSKLIMTIKAIHKRWQGKGCKPDPRVPCVVELDYNHNHDLQSADMLRFRPVSEEVKAKLVNMFHKGHSPASALRILKMDIRMENEEFEHILADRKYCPDYGSCYRLYRKEFSRGYSDGDQEATLDFLEKKADDFNKQAGSRCVIVQKVGNESVIAMCTPLMKRVHKKVKQASELVFVDSTGINEKEGHRIFQVMTHNEIGGLPLGIIIVESETTSTITAGLQLLLEVVGDDGFFSRGAIGPGLFMTNDCDVEKRSISSVWPSAVSITHILQAFWRWVRNTKHGIPANESPALFYLFKGIVYATTQDECVDRYNTLIADEHAKKYPSFLKHVEDMWGRKKDWALYFRLEEHMPMTSNYVESSLKILKENILERVKAFNVVQITDFILTRLDNYYQKKLLDVACNRCPKKSQRFPDMDPTTAAGIKEISQEQFTVPSASSSDAVAYTVDLSVGVCSCVAGSAGAMCKHQHWADLLYGGGATTVDSVTTRALCYEVATGIKPRWEWLDPLYDWCGHDVVMTAVKTEVEETATKTIVKEITAKTKVKKVSTKTKVKEITAKTVVEETSAQVDAVGIDAANSPDTSTLLSKSCNESVQPTHSGNCDLEPTAQQQYDDHLAQGIEALEEIRKVILGFLKDDPEAIVPALKHFKAVLCKATTTASLVSILMSLGEGHIDQQTSNPASAITSSTQNRPSKRKTPHKVTECEVKITRLDTTHSKK